MPRALCPRHALAGGGQTITLRVQVLVKQLCAARQDASVLHAAVTEISLLATSSELCRLAVLAAGGDKALVKLVARTEEYTLLRWTMAALGSLATDEYSRRRQGAAVVRAHGMLLGAHDYAKAAEEKRELSDAAVPNVPEPAPDKVLLEAARLLTNLAQADEPRAMLERLGGLDRIGQWALEHPSTGVLGVLQASGLAARSSSAPGMLSSALPPVPPIGAPLPPAQRSSARREATVTADAADGEEAKAATRVQAGIRGRQVRQGSRKPHATEAPTADTAADADAAAAAREAAAAATATVTVQPLSAEEMAQQEWSATRMQATHRGHAQRRKRRDAENAKAATCVQAAQRGRLSRRGGHQSAAKLLAGDAEAEAETEARAAEAAAEAAASGGDGRGGEPAELLVHVDVAAAPDAAGTDACELLVTIEIALLCAPEPAAIAAAGAQPLSAASAADVATAADDDAEQAAAATRVQAGIRGRQARKNTTCREDHER